MRRRLGLGLLLGALLWTAPLPACAAGALAPNAYFISQMRDRTWNPDGPSWSTNCGPACLVMALQAFGKGGAARPTEQAIRRVRAAITGHADDQSLISLESLRHAAEARGLGTEYAYGLEGVRAELAEGRLVIAAGNPDVYNVRLKDETYEHFSGPHFVLVTGLAADGFWVNDPLSRAGALKLSDRDLAGFMAYRGWKTGLALYPKELDPAQLLFEANR